MNDKIEIVGKGTLVQHGKFNDRIYLMKLDKRDIKEIFTLLSEMAIDNKYSKIICKVPKNLAPLFFAEGFLLEAFIPQFYNNETDVFFVSKFLNSDRLLYVEKERLLDLSTLHSSKLKSKGTKKKGTNYVVRLLNKSDVEQITTIYRNVFETYPFPIHNPGYILKTMDQNVQYYGVEKNGKLAALSSAEIDPKGENAEMTDFATDLEHTGNNLSTLLLNKMEKAMKNQGITTLYTIARLNSISMNKTFYRNAYEYSGTLIKNTNISGKIESMNIYYKHI